MIIHTLYGECGTCARKDLVVVQEDDGGKPKGEKFLAPHYETPDIVRSEICKGIVPVEAKHAHQ